MIIMKKVLLAVCSGFICRALPVWGGEALPDSVIISTLCPQSAHFSGCVIEKNEPFPDDPAGNKRIFVMTRDIPKPAPADGGGETSGDEEYMDADCPSGSCALLGYKEGKLLYAKTIVSYPASVEAACSYGANGTGESCYAEGSTIVHLVDGGSSWHWQELNVWAPDPQPKKISVINKSFHHDMSSATTEQLNGVHRKEWSMPVCEKEPEAPEGAGAANPVKTESTETIKQAELLRPVLEQVLTAYLEAVKKMDLRPLKEAGKPGDPDTPVYIYTPDHAYTVIPRISSTSFDMAQWRTAPLPAKALTIGGEDAGDGYQHYGSTVPYAEAGFRIIRLSDKDFLLEISGVSGSTGTYSGDALLIEASTHRAEYGTDDCLEPFKPYGWRLDLRSGEAGEYSDVPFPLSVQMSRSAEKPSLARVLVSFPEEMPYFAFDYYDQDNGGRALSTIKRSVDDGNALGD